MDNIRLEATRQAMQPTYQHSLVSNSFRAPTSMMSDFSKIVHPIQEKFLAHVSRPDRLRLKFAVMCRKHKDDRFTISFSFPTAAAAQQFNAAVRPFEYNRQGIYFTYQVTAPNSQPPRVEEFVLKVMLGPGIIAEDAFRAMIKHTLTESYGVTVHEMWQPRLNGYAYQPWLAVKCRGKPDLTRPVHHVTWEGLDDWGFMVYYDKATYVKHPELRNPVPTHPTRGHWYAHLVKPAPTTATTTTPPPPQATPTTDDTTASTPAAPAPVDPAPQTGHTAPPPNTTPPQPTNSSPADSREVQQTETQLTTQQPEQPTCAESEPTCSPQDTTTPTTETATASQSTALVRRDTPVATRSSTRSIATTVALGKRSAPFDSDSTPEQLPTRAGNKLARADTLIDTNPLSLMSVQIPPTPDETAAMEEDNAGSIPSTVPADA